MRSLSHRSPLPPKAPLCVSSMVRVCALQERAAQSGWRLGAQILSSRITAAVSGSGLALG